MADQEEVASALSEPQEAVAHRDDVHNDVAAAIASLKGEGNDPSGAASGDIPSSGEALDDKGGTAKAVPGSGAEGSNEDHPEDPARYKNGQFKPSKQGAPEQVAAQEKSPTPESLTKPSEQPSTAAVAAPVSWSAEAKALWASAPPALQQAVLKREQEASNGIRQYSEKVAQFEQALAPVAQEAQRRGMSPDDAIKRLIDGNTFIETQPEQAILWLAQKNGIDLANLASNPPAPQQARPDPAYAQVSQTVQTLEQRLQQIEFGNNLTVAQQFAASKPHYADVEDQLPAFIREVQKLEPGLTGLPLLEKAYDRAIWLNPDVRAKIQASERETAEKARQAEVQAKAQQAAKAAISVKGSSAAAIPPKRVAGNDDGTVYDDVRAAIRQVSAG